MNILVGADIVPTPSNIQNFEKSSVECLVDDSLNNILISADYRIFNLETPLTDSLSPINKAGPVLSASTKSVKGIKSLGANFLTLANNHILDQGVQGLTNTITTLKKNKINFAGAGDCLNDASKPYIFILKGLRIGIYCCAEHEFSIASSNGPGANPFDPLESLDQISLLKSHCDFVLVLYHGGKELYRFPSPYLQKTCRKIIDKGADVVICQHSHCIGCKEKWGNGTIVYGQGNFLFDDGDNEWYSTSLLVNITLNKNNFEVSYIPLEKSGSSVILATENYEKILNAFYYRSSLIKDERFVISQYDDLSAQEFQKYLTLIQGNLFRSVIFRVFNKLSLHKLLPFLLKKRYSVSNICELVNILECEVHRECFLNGLKNKLN